MMTETELRIADLELRIGDIELVLASVSYGYTMLPPHLVPLIAKREKLMEELRCLKQSLPQQQSE